MGQVPSANLVVKPVPNETTVGGTEETGQDRIEQNAHHG